jgi:O-antigen chain-terminating methyltransferase
VDANDFKTEELTAAVRAIQERARARHPSGALGVGGIVVPDLMPVLHARDAADSKVAAIGTVNPRAGGIANAIIQKIKKLISRALDWHVREQVEFNRASMQCIQTLLEALEQNNRALSQLAGYVESVRNEMRAADAGLLAEATELKDIRNHWAQWRQGWEEKLNRSEVYMLRTISELNASFQHRATLTEDSFRKSMLEQHAGFENLLSKSAGEIQERLWADLRGIRAEYEKLIYDELRVVRQRGLAAPAQHSAQPAASPETAPRLDWLRFADRFRGTEDRIRSAQGRYMEHFAGATNVLDIGCGRGEFLEAAKAAGIDAQGIDLSEEAVALCRAKGLNAQVADLFQFLPGLPPRSLGGVYCSQVVEHLPAAQLPDLIRLIGETLRPGAIAAFETPNPECLAIFATHFYLDPTHTRPVPAPLLVFYLEENGFGQIDVKRLEPAIESMPALQELPAGFRDAFFGGLDYSVIARKL